MAYKTILAHCNDKARAARVASVAAELASRFSAHLIGLSVSPPVHIVPAGMPGTPDVIVDDARRIAYRKDIPDLRHTFLEASRAHGVEGEWRERDADSASLARMVLSAARRADLVVLAQKDHAWPSSTHLDVDDAVVMGAGRPVLLVPNDGSASASARRVLVAWSDTREASRAVFDALPLLQQAEAVRVISLGPDTPDANPDADLDICTALVRHNVKCKATERIAAHADVGRSLTEQAIAQKADLLVMGCYGHSRLREFVLGGASRYQLRHMLIPVLMSH
jgi:nucleotide-binding universal stress UspA family protein